MHIVNYEEGMYNGILSKYAYTMADILGATVSNKPKKGVINHHINYASYIPSGGIDTVMITHIWEGWKLDKLKEVMQTAQVGICFSKETEKLLRKKGIKNLTTILPAHEGYTKVKKILISTNVYPDGCKREGMFYELLKNIDVSKFQFYIIGSGWNVEGLNANIAYLPKFEKPEYEKMLQFCDYNLYFGLDEGSMGILDAKSVGMRTIAPIQGFHRELGIDYPFTTQQELNAIFKGLEINPVGHLTWENYCKEHTKIWEKLR
jgi:hypothetical protein